MPIKHAFVSAKDDGGDATLVRPSNWNAAHTGGEGGLYGINVEDLSDNKTLTPNTDEIYQYLNPNGSNRLITLQTTGATAGDRFIVRNTAAYNNANYFLIRTEGGGGTNLEYIYSQGRKEFIYNGTAWVSGGIGTSGYTDEIKNIGIGYKARAGQNSIAIGHGSQADFQGTSVGYDSQSYHEAVAFGQDAQANNSGVAIGLNAYSASVSNGIAIGSGSRCVRPAETVTCIDGSTQKFHSIQGRFAETTLNATPVKLTLGDLGTAFSVQPSSALAFKIKVVARDNVAGHVAMYTFEGLIKRDGANNTVLSACNKTVIHEDDASWDCGVTANDASESLDITITGDGTNPTQWAAVLEGVETRFV